MFHCVGSAAPLGGCSGSDGGSGALDGNKSATSDDDDELEEEGVAAATAS